MCKKLDQSKFHVPGFYLNHTRKVKHVQPIHIHAFVFVYSFVFSTEICPSRKTGTKNYFTQIPSYMWTMDVIQLTLTAVLVLQKVSVLDFVSNGFIDWCIIEIV